MGRKYGQHFLHDPNIIRKLLALVPANQPILEIGTGEGGLTEALAGHTNQPIISYEIDEPLLEKARSRLANAPHVTIIHGDFLEADPVLPENTLVVANIPYYITSPIIDKCLHLPMVNGIFLLVQKEIAVRICASPSTSDYSSFSVFCQTRADVKKLFDVAPGSFRPPPRVDSSYIRLIPNNERLAQIPNLDLYNRMVRSAFWGKRKILLNCLQKSPYLNLDKRILLAAFGSCGISEKARGQELSVLQFIRLASHLSETYHGVGTG